MVLGMKNFDIYIEELGQFADLRKIKGSYACI